MIQNTSKQTAAVQRPSLLLYWLLVPIAYLIFKLKFGFTIVKDKRIRSLRGPVICIGTHSFVLDVAMMILSQFPRRLNVVCGRDVFTWTPIKPIRKAAGLIPTSQFAVDLKSIKQMKQAVDNGCSLALFPEGKISIDGRNLPFPNAGLAKLLRFLNANVVLCHNFGGYSSKPRWGRWRKGKIVHAAKVLLTKEELATLSVDEIQQILVKEFTFNDHDYRERNHLRYRTKEPALGLHYILYKCPKCGAEYQMESDADTLTCTACGNRVTMDEYGVLRPATASDVCPYDRLDRWYDFEKEAIRQETARDDFRLSYPVVWERNLASVNRYEECGEGELYIDRERIGFVGKDFDGNEVELECSLKNLNTIVQKMKEAVDLTIGEDIHRFYFRDGKYSAKYNLIVEERFRALHR